MTNPKPPHQPHGLGDIDLFLRTALDAWAARQGDTPLSRASYQEVLAIFVERLGPFFVTEIETTTDDLIVAAKHPAFSALVGLIDDLHDLDRGTTPLRLRAEKGGSGAALTTEQMRKRGDLLVGMDAVATNIDLKGISPEKYVADRLNKAGDTLRGKPYTAARLKDMRRNTSTRKVKPPPR